MLVYNISFSLFYKMFLVQEQEMCFGVFGLLYSLNTSLFIYAFCNYNVLFKSQWDALIPELRERIKYSSVEQTKRSVLTKKH